MKIKKVMSVIVCLVLLFTFVSCEKKDTDVEIKISRISENYQLAKTANVTTVAINNIINDNISHSIDELSVEEKQRQEEKKEEKQEPIKTEEKKISNEMKTPSEPEKQEEPKEEEEEKEVPQAAITSSSNPISLVLTLTNKKRASEGLGSVSLDNTLCQMAAERVTELKDSWSHTRPDGSNVTALAADYNLDYSIIGENLGRGQQTAERVFEMWVASSGHYKNIVGPYTRIGIGYCVIGETSYWVQIFAD